MMSVSPSSRKRKARDSNPQPQKGRLVSTQLPRLFGYLPYISGPTGNRTRQLPQGKHWPPRQGGVVPLDHQPVFSGPDRGRTDHTDLARISRLHRHAGPFIERSVRGLNPIFRLTTAACDHNTYRPSLSQVIPGRIELPISWVSARRLRRWTTGSCSVTEAGVEPAKSPRSQRDRFACLRTRPFSSSGSGSRTRQSWLMRPG